MNAAVRPSTAMAIEKIQPIASFDQSPSAGFVTPTSWASGLLNTLQAYTWPIERWIARAAGGASQRLYPGPATDRSLFRNANMHTSTRPATEAAAPPVTSSAIETYAATPAGGTGNRPQGAPTACVPHSGHRPGEARRSYPHRRHRPAVARRRVRRPRRKRTTGGDPLRLPTGPGLGSAGPRRVAAFALPDTTRPAGPSTNAACDQPS